MLKKINILNKEQYKTIMETAKQDSVFIAEIDGKNIQNINQYLKEIWDVFKFPITGYINYHAYLDWIRDLEWLNSNGYLFVIQNYCDFMKNSPNDRQIILNSLENLVIPWWEGEVEKCVVEGKAKLFNVYLVE